MSVCLHLVDNPGLILDNANCYITADNSLTPHHKWLPPVQVVRCPGGDGGGGSTAA